MKITVTSEKTADDQVTAKVSVPAKEVDASVKKAYKDIAHKYNFQGFRRGHAPRPVIDSIVGREGVLAQATNDLMELVQPEVLEHLDLVAIGQPDWGTNTDPVVEHKVYHAECVIGVAPTCTLKSYDAPSIKLPPENATESEITAQLDQLLSYQSKYEDDPDASVAAADSVVDASIEDKQNASKWAGDKRTFNLASKTLPQALVEGLVGMKVGETKEISWSDKKTDEAQDKPADPQADTCVVSATLNAVKKFVTPELTDELAKSTFGFDNVDALKDAIKEEIEQQKKQSLPGLKEDRVVAALGEELELEKVPEPYQNQVFSELAQEVLGQLSRQGLTLDVFLKARNIDRNDFMNDLHAQAEERARQSLALDALVDKLELDCKDSDIKDEFKAANVKDVKASIDQFKKEGRLPAVRQSIRRTKAVKWLVENCTVEVVDELAEAQAAAAKGQEDKKEAAADAPSEDK